MRDDDLVSARAALFVALDALEAHRDALILIGAQAVYLWTEDVNLPLAETTDDSDLALDGRVLGDDPLVEDALTEAGFRQDAMHPQPGSWVGPGEVPVDILMPDALSGPGSTRGAKIPPHGRMAARRTKGIEGTVVSYERRPIPSLDPGDPRTYEIKVARPGALLLAKLHKLAERHADRPDRLDDKTRTISTACSWPSPPTISAMSSRRCLPTRWPQTCRTRPSGISGSSSRPGRTQPDRCERDVPRRASAIRP